MKIAPWKDYAGNEIKDGDVIRHPSGETGNVVYIAEGGRNGEKWFVDYGGEPLALLSLQVGWKGQAQVVPNMKLTLFAEGESGGAKRNES